MDGSGGVESPGYAVVVRRVWPSVWPEAKGWRRLYRVEDPDEEGEEILAAYCRACAVTEFGGSWAERKEAED